MQEPAAGKVEVERTALLLGCESECECLVEGVRRVEWGVGREGEGLKELG